MFDLLKDQVFFPRVFNENVFPLKRPANWVNPAEEVWMSEPEPEPEPAPPPVEKSPSPPSSPSEEEYTGGSLLHFIPFSNTNCTRLIIILV